MSEEWSEEFEIVQLRQELKRERDIVNRLSAVVEAQRKAIDALKADTEEFWKSVVAAWDEVEQLKRQP